VQSEFLLHALYITDDLNIAAMLRAACKRCGAKKVVGCRTVSEAIDKIAKKKFQAHLVIEDANIFEQYHFFPVQFFSSCKRFMVPPPCLALCNTDRSFDLKVLKSGYYVDYVPKPLNESFLEQRIRAVYQKSYSYHRGGMLTEVIETLINSGEIEKAYSLLLPALAKSPKSFDYIGLLSKILFEMKELPFSELAVRYLMREDKDNSFAKTMLAKILLSTGRVKEANKLEL
jgi:response regulator RpfG family c-di-GMP phosphodiesterase